MIKKTVFLVFLIFSLAFFLRFWQTNNLPTFISDEASIGFNAYSILKTSRDEWGKFFPLTFKGFGEHKLPLYVYTTVPFVWLFELNELVVRLPSVLFGSLTVITVYFLVKELSFKKPFAIHWSLITSFLLAISPWHIQVSRMALEANLSLFLIVLGTLLFLRGLKRSGYFYHSLIIFTLSLYTYNAARLFVPLLVLGLMIIFREKLLKRPRQLVLPLVLSMAILLPIISGGFKGTGERLSQVGIFSDPGILAGINEKRAVCQKTTLPLLCRLRYNRPVVYSLVYFENYLSHFSWGYLFSQGAGLAHYSVPQRGVLYYFELPLLILGAVYLIKFKKPFWFLLTWLLTAPLANSFTGKAHPVRAIFLLPIFQILIAAGLIFIIEIFKKRKKAKVFILVIFLVVSLASMVDFSVDYFINYPMVYTSTWQAGYKSLFFQLTEFEKNYEKIYVSKFYGEPHIFYLFYRQYDPESYQENQEVVRYVRDDNWINVDRIGQYYFLQEVKPEMVEKGSLLAAHPSELFPGAETLKEIKYNDGKVAFVIAEIK